MHVDEELIVVANFDGEIKVVYAEEVRKHPEGGKVCTGIESGETMVRNGVCPKEVKKECKKEYDEQSDD